MYYLDKLFLLFLGIFFLPAIFIPCWFFFTAVHFPLYGMARQSTCLLPGWTWDEFWVPFNSDEISWLALSTTTTTTILTLTLIKWLNYIVPLYERICAQQANVLLLLLSQFSNFEPFPWVYYSTSTFDSV